MDQTRTSDYRWAHIRWQIRLMANTALIELGVKPKWTPWKYPESICAKCGASIEKDAAHD